MLTQLGTAVVGWFLSTRWHCFCPLSYWSLNLKEQWAGAKTEHRGLTLLGRQGGLQECADRGHVYVTGTEPLSKWMFSQPLLNKGLESPLTHESVTDVGVRRGAGLSDWSRVFKMDALTRFPSQVRISIPMSLDFLCLES